MEGYLKTALIVMITMAVVARVQALNSLVNGQ
jgi:hypothetical protein